MRPKRQEVRVSAIWRYFIYSVLVGRCSTSLNSPPLLMIQGLFKSIFTILLFKGPKETIDVSTFLTFQIIWIFLCRFPYLDVHYSANCTLHCHQQSALVMCWLWPKARSQAKPGQKKPSQARPNHLAFVGFWPGLHFFKAQAGA